MPPKPSDKTATKPRQNRDKIPTDQLATNDEWETEGDRSPNGLPGPRSLAWLSGVTGPGGSLP